MDIDLGGRVNNTKLAHSNCLLPLFEAIVKSIHAVEERGKIKGSIEITVERGPSQGVLEAEQLPLAAGPIRGFIVQDDGIGFTHENFRSFGTSDTTKKVAKGGMGVGRLVWLKAFEKAEIDSLYVEDGRHRRRRFTFACTKHGIEDLGDQGVAEAPGRTTVRLVGFRPDYGKCCPRTASTIARLIVEHCLEFFARDAGPRNVLNDPDGEARIDLKRFYVEQMRVRSETRNFSVNGKEFRANHVLVNSGADGQHRIFFCAHSRADKSEGLASKVPNLVSPLKEPDGGTSIVCSGFASGQYLDETVNAERTAFHVLDQIELNLPGELFWEDLVKGMVAQAGEFLSPYTMPVRKSKQDRIRDCVHTQAPQYRLVIKHRSEWLDEIPAILPDDKLDVELYKIDQQYGAELREEALQLQATNGKLSAVEDHRAVFKKYIEEWNEHGMAKLAKYVAHRKATLAFLADRLGLKDDGRYPLEESVHQIIFPLRQTSDDIHSDRMNLWMIDEKLAYHHYLASDKLFKQLEPIEIESKNRPDLLIFNRPFAFADSDPPFGSIVLVEFKRPARDDYTDEENPIAQVYGYVREIKAGTAKDRHGRPIRVPPSTPFYAYLVCDLAPKLMTQAENAQLTPTPDSLGFFGYNSNLGVYVEILSFNKLVNDARKRNAVLFEKLGLRS